MSLAGSDSAGIVLRCGGIVSRPVALSQVFKSQTRADRNVSAGHDCVCARMPAFRPLQ